MDPDRLIGGRCIRLAECRFEILQVDIRIKQRQLRLCIVRVHFQATHIQIARLFRLAKIQIGIGGGDQRIARNFDALADKIVVLSQHIRHPHAIAQCDHTIEARPQKTATRAALGRPLGDQCIERSDCAIAGGEAQRLAGRLKHTPAHQRGGSVAFDLAEFIVRNHSGRSARKLQCNLRCAHFIDRHNAVVPGRATAGVELQGTIDIAQRLDRPLLPRGRITGGEQDFQPFAIDPQIGLRQRYGGVPLAQIDHAADFAVDQIHIVRRLDQPFAVKVKRLGGLSEMAVGEGDRFNHVIRPWPGRQRGKQLDGLALVPRPSGNHDKIIIDRQFTRVFVPQPVEDCQCRLRVAVTCQLRRVVLFGCPRRHRDRGHRPKTERACDEQRTPPRGCLNQQGNWFSVGARGTTGPSVGIIRSLQTEHGSTNPDRLGIYLYGSRGSAPGGFGQSPACLTSSQVPRSAPAPKSPRQPPKLHRPALSVVPWSKWWRQIPCLKVRSAAPHNRL